MNLQEALEHIIAGSGWECERFTTGIGACFFNGMKPDAQYWSDRCCPSCMAHVALAESPPNPIQPEQP